jgi:hypothetical protein
MALACAFEHLKAIPENPSRYIMPIIKELMIVRDTIHTDMGLREGLEMWAVKDVRDEIWGGMSFASIAQWVYEFGALEQSLEMWD